MARIHGRALSALVSPVGSRGIRDGVLRRAGRFFVGVITPIEETHRAAIRDHGRSSQKANAEQRMSIALAAANRRLQREIALRRAAREELKRSQKHYRSLLVQSRNIQAELRHLSRHVLWAQEEERKEISRNLHDEIAQVLTGINAHLATLKQEASANAKGFTTRIARTQRLVEKSLGTVHRFAVELRPAVLDDLGLVPAIQSLMKGFGERTGIRLRLVAFAGLQKLPMTERTVLYRVVQAALANVAQHAEASRAKVSIRRLPNAKRMEIADDGKSFDVKRVLLARHKRRLGLLGMRERVEMVGGTFAVESSPGKGTTVRVEIPFDGDARDQT